MRPVQPEFGPLTAQQNRVGAAVAEHRLAGVAGQHGELGTFGEHPHQPRRLRVEVLCVVDQQQRDAGTFGGQQIGIHRERIQRRAHEFGRTQRGNGGLRRSHAHRGAQQHDLLVGLREAPRRPPLRPVGAAAQPL